jgi:hypothetical protein
LLNLHTLHRHDPSAGLEAPIFLPKPGMGTDFYSSLG